MSRALTYRSQPADRTLTHRRHRQVAALLELGFECADLVPTTTERVATRDGGMRIAQAVAAMGTVVSVATVGRSADRLEEALGHAWELMHRLIGVFNRYDEASAVAVLNRQGAVADAPPALASVLDLAGHVRQRSEGAFDVTVQPLVDRLAAVRDGAPTPADDELHDLCGRVDGDAIRRRGETIAFTRPEMGVTLDGIAKGFIVDRMADVLAEAGIHGYLINAGGDVRCAGTRDSIEPWRISVRDPETGDERPETIRVRSGALATSGSYEIYFDRERLLHHLVDPQAGPANRSRSVTVRAPTAALADALATAVFVMEPAAGVSLIEGVPGCSCLVLSGAGGEIRSTRWVR